MPRGVFMTWEERRDHLARWVESNGRTPSQMSDDPVERGCYSWLTTNRKKFKSGTLTDEQERLFRELPVSVTSRNTLEDRIAELEAFHARHRRLPLTTAVSKEEKSLATFVVSNLRPKIKRGRQGPLLERAKAIPGVADFGLIPDQDKILAELVTYAAEHGHMPPFGPPAKGDEYRLSTWASNNIQGSPATKSPALRARHEAILRLMERYPTASESYRAGYLLRREQSLRDLEEFTAKHGHLPSGTRATDQESVHLATAVTSLRKDLEAGTLEGADQVRAKAILQYPSIRDYEWQASFEALVQYAAAHNGRLPGNWGEGKLFSWLTSQRRRYRNGTLTPQRLDKLRSIDGAIPAEVPTREP